MIDLRVVIQRVLNSKIIIDNFEEKNINQGLMILVGMTYNDNEDDINYLIKKILNLRIFTDDNDKMNYSVSDIKGDILLVPQFTLYANTKKGNRPSFENALEPSKANELFEVFKSEIIKSGLNIEFGKFGSHMEITLTNNGPVTIIIDSKER